MTAPDGSTPAGTTATGSGDGGPAPAVTVRVPTILRAHTGGVSEVRAAGTTVAEVLESLEADHPGIRHRVVDDSGALRRFVNVYVGDEDVRFADGLATPTPAGTVVSFIPAVAGG